MILPLPQLIQTEEVGLESAELSYNHCLLLRTNEQASVPIRNRECSERRWTLNKLIRHMSEDTAWDVCIPYWRA